MSVIRACCWSLLVSLSHKQVCSCLQSHEHCSNYGIDAISTTHHTMRRAQWCTGSQIQCWFDAYERVNREAYMHTWTATNTTAARTIQSSQMSLLLLSYSYVGTLASSWYMTQTRSRPRSRKLRREEIQSCCTLASHYQVFIAVSSLYLRAGMGKRRSIVS